MSEETKKDEGIAGTTGQEPSASPVPDSKLDEVVGGKTTQRIQHGDFQITRFVDQSSPKLYES
jgi:type VI protein secretion system component Hcp